MKKVKAKRIAKRISILLLFLVLFLLSPQETTHCQSGCTSESHHCTSNCCLGVRSNWQATGCTLWPSGYCTMVWDTDVVVSCPSPGCLVNFNVKTCTFHSGPNRCTLDPSYQEFGCCLAGNPPATATPIPPTSTSVPVSTPTTAATRTPTSTATRTATTTATVAPMSASLTPRYSSLVLMGPGLGLPAQTLNGTIAGGSAPYSATLHVARPDGSQTTYNLTPGTAFRFGPTEAGNPSFGVTLQGTWRAWVVVTDSASRSVTSNTAVWDVVFYPIHGQP